MDHKQLLKNLGGEHAVHAALVARGMSLTPVAVRAWALSDRAIPAKYWTHLRDIAVERGFTVSIEEMAEAVTSVPSDRASPSSAAA